jgi:peptide subunit release factor 1 (eRF1)
MFATRPRDYQVLLDRPRGQGMVVSCYADTTIAEGFEPHWRQDLKAEAGRVRKLLAGDPTASKEFEQHLERIRTALESPEARRARGLAVFSASGWDQALALPSRQPYQSQLVVNEEAYLVPLLAACSRCPEYLVVVTDTHHGRIYESDPAEACLIDEINEVVPRKNRSAGERWGKQQATIARHREDHILHYYKELAERVERAWNNSTYQGIILLGEHEVLEAFRTHLSKPIADRVVAESPQAWAGDQPAIEDRVRKVVDAAVAPQQERLLDEIEGRLKEGYAVATGPREVIETLNNGRVRELIFGPDPGEVASRCTGCRSLFVTVEESCPYCKAPCGRANLWQEILSMAVRHRIRISFVTSESRRGVPGGIAALLLRDEPSSSMGETAAAR